MSLFGFLGFGLLGDFAAASLAGLLYVGVLVAFRDELRGLFESIAHPRRLGERVMALIQVAAWVFGPFFCLWYFQWLLEKVG